MVTTQRKMRVLVVDDSVLMRRIITDVLYGEPDIEIAGTAANGRIALSMIPQVNPDLVTLDVEMPELDGLATLTEIRKHYPKLVVVMVSSFTEKGAGITIDALTKGANDYIYKPAKVGSFDAARDLLKDGLVSKIRSFCPFGAPSAPPPRAIPRAAPPSPPARRAVSPIEAVVIGVSTGGPNALSEVLPEIPRDFPVPILIVQHMPPLFTRLLGERLSQISQIPIQEAAAQQTLEPGKAWIAPGDYHMTLVRDGLKVRIALNQEPAENSCRPSVDVMFRSAAKVFGAATVGVILTGMGQDGLRGCEDLRAAGAQILAQDEASSVVWGMPGFVAQAGLADRVLPLKQMASEIRRRVTESLSAGALRRSA